MNKQRYGTPDAATRRLGEEIARLRTARGWSRSQLIKRSDRIRQSDDEADALKSESDLAHLENGRKVKVSRKTINALARALNCNTLEKARLLLYADRSVFGDDDGTPDAVAEALNYTMGRIYDEAYDILADLISQPRAAELNEDELFEIIATALELVMKRRRK